MFAKENKFFPVQFVVLLKFCFSEKFHRRFTKYKASSGEIFVTFFEYYLPGGCGKIELTEAATKGVL